MKLLALKYKKVLEKKHYSPETLKKCLTRGRGSQTIARELFRGLPEAPRTRYKLRRLDPLPFEDVVTEAREKRAGMDELACLREGG